jgi:OFA family oxalate/formate antiporter-like MFS transporter
MMAASYLLWLPFTGYGWLAAFAATLGFGYGVRIALTPVVLIEFFGLENLGGVLGLFFTASSISAICGPLLAGLIIDQTGSYQSGVAFALLMGVMGFIAVAPLPRSTLSALSDNTSRHRDTDTLACRSREVRDDPPTGVLR